MKDYIMWYVIISCCICLFAFIFGDKRKVSLFTFILMMFFAPVLLIFIFISGIRSIFKSCKNVDYKLERIGFIKVHEDKHCASYERNEDRFKYIQRLDLLHKDGGRHLIQSYEKGCNSDKFNNMIGLSMYESELALKKMKQMRWRKIKG